MAKVMFLAHDPGGANAISPLIEYFDGAFVYAKGSALLKLPNAKEYIEGELERIMPDFLITGTSANDKTEKVLWQKAKKLGIKSMAILDHWVNYGIRFSRWGLNEIEKFDKNPDIFPDYICVMDEFAKSEMIKDGVSEKIIYPLGNPHFENLIKQSKNVKDIRNNFASKNEILITFASEPYIEDYGYGNEKQVLTDLIELVPKNAVIVVKLHPKEDFSKYSEFKGVILDKNTPPHELIMASDCIISMTSMFLIEAMILGKNILSYQPNEVDCDKFILTHKKALPFINCKTDFSVNLLNILSNGKNLSYNYDAEFSAIDKIVKFIKDKI